MSRIVKTREELRQVIAVAKSKGWNTDEYERLLARDKG